MIGTTRTIITTTTILQETRRNCEAMGDLNAFLLSWSFEPEVVIGLLLAAGLYARGWRRLRRRGRGGRAMRPWRAWCFGGGLVAIAVALLSPIATFDSLFMFMHMIQHLLLVMIAAPLIWLGAPMLPMMWAFRRPTRRRLGRLMHRGHPVHRVFHFLTRPSVALPILVITILFWHYPTFYDAAQGRTLIHDLEHATFFAAALLYYWPLIQPTGGKRRMSYGAGILYLFPAKITGFVVGAALSMAQTPWYQTYINAPRLWGLSALGDQQLAGLIMWIFGGLLYIIPLLILVVAMIREDEGDVWVPELVREQQAAAVSGDVEAA
jgi:cytochrome c oxidase assembly factor CtaG